MARQDLKRQRFLQLLLPFGRKANDPDLSVSAAALHGKPGAAAAVGDVVGVIAHSAHRCFGDAVHGGFANLEGALSHQIDGELLSVELRSAGRSPAAQQQTGGYRMLPIRYGYPQYSADLR